ncbi:hypothetical protein HOY80DRAFT_739293 [Tuber brumale]|nr:hypothetical protein HOY80DRAFT_739293 [Tuber brumale]
MVQQLIPTVLRIRRDQLRPLIRLPHVSPVAPELNTFFGLFSDDSFTEARAAERVNALGAWQEPLIRDLDNEHQFEAPASWGIDDDRPSDTLWHVYCESLSTRYPNRSPLILPSPISLDNLPTTFLTPEIRQRLPQCSNLLFILRRNLHEYWFGDLNFHTTILHILAPWPAGAAGVLDILSAYAALEQCLRVATRDPACRIDLTQGYNISPTPHLVDRSWRYVLRALTLWHEASNPNEFWPRPATLVDSTGWDIPGFMGGLPEMLYQQQNEHPEGPTVELPEQAAVVMPQGVLQLLISLTHHVKTIEFAKREIDNGAEGILFSGIPNTVDDECGTGSGSLCPVEVTALRRSQKQIIAGRTIPAVKMADIVPAGREERFQNQIDTHPPGASSEQIAASQRLTELHWNHGVNETMVGLDENGQGFIKSLEMPQYPAFMSTLVNSTNILRTGASSAILPYFAYLEIDNQPPIFWIQRRRPGLEPEDRIMSTREHNFYGPTPWMIQEPLCTEAIESSHHSNMAIIRISRLLGNDLNFVPAMVAARATRFGQWTLENYTMDPFDREERFQRTQTLPDPRGLEPTGWLTSDIMDAVTTRYNRFHTDAEIFSVSITTLLAVTGDSSHLEQRPLGARFWIFIQSNVQADQSGNHFWISIVDRVKGHFFSHNSLRDVGDPSILFAVLRPVFESPRVQNIAGSAPTLTRPANTVVDVPQQLNGYDCGVYSVRTITGFLEGLSEIQGPIPADGESQAARSYIPENWSSTEYRGFLRRSFPIRPPHAGGISTTPNLLNNVLTALSDANHEDDVERAMWHLDNAGGILLQMSCLPVGNLPVGCLCENHDNRCGFSVVPVPPGYKRLYTLGGIVDQSSTAPCPTAIFAGLPKRFDKIEWEQPT